jgi:hypothetical protein
LALIFLIPLLLVTPLLAVEMKGLYEVEVAVEGQSSDQRRTAIREAFYQVLVKVTGHRQLNGNILRSASRYVQQYRYRTIEVVVDELIADDQPLEDELKIEASIEEVALEPEYLLWVRFDSIAVNRLLREKELPIWGAARPSIVIWLSQEQQGQRTMLQPEMLPEMALAVEEQAQQRGLSVMLPLMDMEDYQRLPVSALWGGFTETIQHASSRYGVEVVLTGRLVATEKQWQVEWHLYQDELVEVWTGASSTLSEVVAQGVEQMSDRLAERYTRATADDSLSQLQVVVTDIDDLAGYARVRRYFESLVMVEQAVLLTMESNRAEFLLNVQGGGAALIQGVKLGSVLAPVANKPVGEIVEVTEVVDDTLEGPFLPEPIARERATFRLR